MGLPETVSDHLRAIEVLLVLLISIGGSLAIIVVGTMLGVVLEYEAAQNGEDWLQERERRLPPLRANEKEVRW